MQSAQRSVILGGNDSAKEYAMGMLDKLKGLMKGHEEQAGKGIDKAGDYVDERTQGKYRSQVDTTQEKLREQLGGQDPDQDQPPR
jgi:Na+/phosphate symporter